MHQNPAKKETRREFIKYSSIALFSLFLPKNLHAKQQDSTENTEHIQGKKIDIFLTIDDGPKNNLETIIKILGQENKATFFMIGSLLDANNGYLSACHALELGHEIGNHSYSHPPFSAISINKAKKEIEKTEKLIAEIYSSVGRENPMLFRFPYGDSGFYINQETREKIGSLTKKKAISSFLKEYCYKTCNWSLDTEDWRYYSRQHKKSIKSIMKLAEIASSEEIVLVHELPITAKTIIPFYVYSGIYNLKTICNA